jgi:lipocalin
MGLIFDYPLAFVPHVNLPNYCRAPWYEIASLPSEMQTPLPTRVTEAYTYSSELLYTHGVSVDIVTTGASGAPVATKAELCVDYMYTPAPPDVHDLMLGAFTIKYTASDTAPIASPCPEHYWIIALDTAHYTYAVVSEPTRRRLRILSSRETMSSALFNRLISDLQHVHGFSKHQLRHLCSVASARKTVAA